MAKKSQKIAVQPTPQEKLKSVPALASAFASLLEDLFGAEVTLSEATDDAVKDQARAAIVDAKAKLREMLGGLEFVLEVKPIAGDERKFTATTEVHHGGEKYAAGDEIPLDHASFVELKAAGAVEGEWDD